MQTVEREGRRIIATQQGLFVTELKAWLFLSPRKTVNQTGSPITNRKIPRRSARVLGTESKRKRGKGKRIWSKSQEREEEEKLQLCGWIEGIPVDDPSRVKTRTRPIGDKIIPNLMCDSMSIVTVKL